MARLHVICGNCGSANDWTLRIERDGDDVTDDVEKYEDSASMLCGNCATLHDLKDNANKVEYSE